MTRVVLVVVLLLSMMGLAHADEAGARKHFRRGVDLYDKRLYTEALEEFRAAYAEKASAGIKQNIALCQKGLGRNEEAATSFDEALDEGRDSLKESTRSAMQQELAELVKIVGTLNVTMLTADDHRPIEGSISVDGVAIPKTANHRPIRLAPGIHVVGAHVDGMPEPPEKKLSFVAGQPVDATFEIGIQSGTLTVRASVEASVIRIDRKEVARGSWSGRVAAGRHHIEVSAVDWATTSLDVTVAPGTAMDFPIELRRPTRAPELYPTQPAPLEAPFKRRYVAASFAVDGENLRLSSAEGEVAEGKRRDFSGVSGAARFGYRVSKFFAVEGHLELGQMTAKYRIKSADPIDTSTKIMHWAAMPVLRFSSPGKVRFTIAGGFGAHGTGVKADVYQSSGQTTVTRSGSGVSLGWMVDAGAQLELGPVFIEPLVFFELHGLAAVKEDASGDRMLQASPGARAGVRLGIGVPF